MEKLAPNGAGSFFLRIQTLSTFWAERIFILRVLIFWILLDPKFPDFQIQQFWISRFPDFWSSRFPDFHMAGRPGAGNGSTAAPDHKVGEIQGTRAIP